MRLAGQSAHRGCHRDNSQQARTDSATNFAQNSVTYIDSDLSVFSTNYWQGAKINFSPGYKIEWTTCDVASSTSSALNVVCNIDPGVYNNGRTVLDTGPGSYYLPGPQNPYYLWGKYQALDVPGEWFRDTNGTLYLWSPDSSNPTTKTVEARRRAWAFDIRGRSYVTIQGLRLFAATLKTDAGTSNTLIDGIEGYYLWHFQEIPPLYRIEGTRAIEFRGSNNTVQNSLLAHSAGLMLDLSGFTDSGAPSNNRAINNVIYDIAYRANRQGIIIVRARAAQRVCVVSQNTVFDSDIGIHAARSEHAYNDIYRSHHQIDDLSTIYAWNTDGLNAEIAYNYSHDGLGEYNNSLQFYGTTGIYLDDDSRNYRVHHNVVWNMPLYGIFTFGSNNAKFYNNTVDGKIDFDIKSGQSLTGTDVRNNASTIADYSQSQLTVSNNYVGVDLWVNSSGRNYQLRADSPAINAGIALPPYTDGYIGPAPDQGAYESGVTPFVAGAVIRDRDLAGLQVSCPQDAGGSTAFCTVTNLPLGRKLPLNFQVRIGSATAAQNCLTVMNYVTSLGTGYCANVPTGGQSGNQTISVRIGGGSWQNAPTPADLGALAISSITPSSGPLGGGTQVTITGRRFQPSASGSNTAFAQTVTINNSGTSVLYDYQVPVQFNSAALIAAGKMRNDCGDLRFRDAYGLLNYWLEEGCNTATTRVWVRVKTLPVGNSTITLTYGNSALSSFSNGAATFFYFDDFNDGVLSLQITLLPEVGFTVAETGGQMRIAGTTNSSTQYSTAGFHLNEWEFQYPQNFAVDSEFSVITGPATFKASVGAWGLTFYNNLLPKRIGYYDTSWHQLGISTVNTATPSRLKVSMAVIGPKTNQTVRWFENGNFAAPLAMRSGLNDSTPGGFIYGPDQANQTFDARFDNIRIRSFSFPEPTTSVGAEQIASSRITFDGVACRNLVVSSSTQAQCYTPPHAAGSVAVAITNLDNSTASFSSYTYVANRPDTIGIYRPSTNTFYLRNSNSTGIADITVSLVSLGMDPTTYRDVPVVGDWNGDGIDTVGFYRRGRASDGAGAGLFVLSDSNTTPRADYSFVLGNPSDTPMVGDWDGDGRDSVGVFRPSNGLIYLKNNMTTGFADFTMVLGNPGDVGIAGDWNNDGKDSPGVYRPGASPQFYLTNQTCNCIVASDYNVVFGNPGDQPFTGDWDGDGRAGLGIYRTSNGITYLRNDPTTTGFSDFNFVYGVNGDYAFGGVWSGTTPPAQQVEIAPTFVPKH
ncbi:MAG: DUF2341 domain-containing protein [Anaerolineae bacterium]